MREIKFRAWNPKKAVMFVYSLDRVDSKSIWTGLLSLTRNTNPDVILMQHTGLKDKNGFEKYEGDIVRSRGVDGLLLWEIVWTDLDVLTGFDYRPINHSFSCVHNKVDEIGEVIGNIYENPDLLEVKS